MTLTDKKIAILIFSIAVIVRFGYLLYAGPLNFIPPDTRYYISGAKDLLTGVFPYKGFYAIGYVVSIALVFSIFGIDNLLGVIIFQVVLGALTAVLCFFIGKDLYNKLTGILAGLLAASLPTLIFWTRYILAEILFVFLLILFVWVLTKFVDKRKAGYLLFGFGILGFMILTKALAILILPFTLLWLFLIYKNEKLALYKWVIAGLLIIFLLYLPYIACNFGISNDVMRTPKGLIDNFKFSVTQGLQWNEKGRGTGGVDIMPREEWLKRAEEFRGRPFKMAHLMWRKLKVFWWIYTPEMSLRHRIVRSISLGPLYIFTLIGLFFARKHWKKIALLAILIISLTLPPILNIVDYDLRYHLPVEALCILISAYGVSVLWERLLTWKRRRLYQ